MLGGHPDGSASTDEVFGTHVCGLISAPEAYIVAISADQWLKVTSELVTLTPNSQPKHRPQKPKPTPRYGVSTTSVTGPSFTKATAMSAPKIPRCTGTPSEASSAQKAA